MLTKVARESRAQDGVVQALGTLEVGVYLGHGLADEGEATVNFGDDAVLFGKWWERNPKGFKLRFIQYWQSCCGCVVQNLFVAMGANGP